MKIPRERNKNLVNRGEGMGRKTAYLGMGITRILVGTNSHKSDKTTEILQNPSCVIF